MKKAYAEGNEIASHANGHYDGSKWSTNDWTNEFNQWATLIFKAGPNNGFAQPDLGFGLSTIKGFRAPLLGQGPPLYPALAAKGFAYDTSKTNAVNYWPKKISGLWDFPLAQVKIAGSGKRTLSMDYNFYFAQSGGVDKSANKALYKKEMLSTYMQYFEANYFGNRAPVSIGHHFSKWNGGAYWEAMQEFAKKVCGQPEVKCVTYRELTAFMEHHAGQRDAFASARFAGMRRPPGASEPAAIDPVIPEEDMAANGLVGDVSAAHETNFDEGADVSDGTSN